MTQITVDDLSLGQRKIYDDLKSGKVQGYNMSRRSGKTTIVELLRKVGVECSDVGVCVLLGTHARDSIPYPRKELPTVNFTTKTMKGDNRG